MAQNSIAAALIAEHEEIDVGIAQFVARVGELGPAPDAAAVREAAGPLLGAFTALRRHIYLEEEFVFPALDAPSLRMAIMVMYREHGQIWRLMDQAEAQIADHETPAADVLDTCETMLQELQRHNAKEEPIIYPHTDADLAESEQERLGQFLAAGTMPAGWTCPEAVAGPARLPFGDS